MSRLTSALALPLFAASLAASGQASLRTLRDHARVLLIFAPSTEDVRARRQLHILDPHRDDSDQRDLVTVLLTPGQESIFPSSEQTSVRKSLHIAPGEFAVVLVGKDGGEKLRSTEPIAWNELASTIDAMPMRQDEIKHPRPN